MMSLFLPVIFLEIWKTRGHHASRHFFRSILLMIYVMIRKMIWAYLLGFSQIRLGVRNFDIMIIGDRSWNMFIDRGFSYELKIWLELWDQNLIVRPIVITKITQFNTRLPPCNTFMSVYFRSTSFICKPEFSVWFANSLRLNIGFFAIDCRQNILSDRWYHFTVSYRSIIHSSIHSLILSFINQTNQTMKTFIKWISFNLV